VFGQERRVRCEAATLGLVVFGMIGCGGSAAKSDGGERDAVMKVDVATIADAKTSDAGDAFVPVATPGAAVAYQIDVAHTGNQPTTTLSPPLSKRWMLDLDGVVSYPLIVDGRVFVTVGDDTTFMGGKLYAIDLATGATSWGPIDIPGTQLWLNAAYDQGRVYVLNFAGHMAAFDAQTGTQLWAVSLPGQYAFQSAPSATAGMVFVDGDGSGNTVYGIDGATGIVKWTRVVNGGDHCSPAVSAGGVFISYQCPEAIALDPVDGTPLWSYEGMGGCIGGPGTTAAVYDSRVWARFNNYTNQILDVATGNALGDFAAGPIPAFHDRRGFFLADGTLQANDLDSGATAWSFTGDGTLVTAPIVANGVVYVGGSSGNVYAVGRDDRGAGLVGHGGGRDPRADRIHPSSAQRSGSGRRLAAGPRGPRSRLLPLTP
jgi:outer membrane protein assembly factor BamB